MRAFKQIITQLNRYLQLREAESAAKAAKEDVRDAILELLPPNTANEWELTGWGRVSYKKPKDAVTVDLELLKKKFPKAYAACVSEKPSAARFCVYPETNTLIEALKGARHAEEGNRAVA